MEKAPYLTVFVTGLGDEKGKPTEEIDYTIPKWLNPEAIYGHFNGNPIEFYKLKLETTLVYGLRPY
jgi:hypothetical protein